MRPGGYGHVKGTNGAGTLHEHKPRLGVGHVQQLAKGLFKVRFVDPSGL